jgi:hypothetical protein
VGITFAEVSISKTASPRARTLALDFLVDTGAI